MSEFHCKPHTFVSQVDVKVGDLERSLTFYQNVIGFQVMEQNERKAVLTADGQTALLTIEQPVDVMPKQPRTTGLYHFALLLPTRADLARVLRRFIDVQYPLQGASNHGVSEALYLADPDGNGIEIYADTPASTWHWVQGQVTMVSEQLDIESLLAEEEGVGWQGLPSDTVMGHIHLHASELRQIETFYTKGLGFDIVTRYGNQALFLSDGGYHHHIGVNTWNGVGAPAPANNSVGLQIYTIQYRDEEALQEVAERLRGMGYQALEENGAFVTQDPSGNRIRLTV